MSQKKVVRLTAKILTRKMATVIILIRLAGKFSFTLVRPDSSKRISMKGSGKSF